MEEGLGDGTFVRDSHLEEPDRWLTQHLVVGDPFIITKVSTSLLAVPYTSHGIPELCRQPFEKLYRVLQGRVQKLPRGYRCWQAAQVATYRRDILSPRCYYGREHTKADECSQSLREKGEKQTFWWRKRTANRSESATGHRHRSKAKGCSNPRNSRHQYHRLNGDLFTSLSSAGLGSRVSFKKLSLIYWIRFS